MTGWRTIFLFSPSWRLCRFISVGLGRLVNILGHSSVARVRLLHATRWRTVPLLFLVSTCADSSVPVLAGWLTCRTLLSSVPRVQLLHAIGWRTVVLVFLILPIQHMCRLVGTCLNFMCTACTKIVAQGKDPMPTFPQETAWRLMARKHR